KAVFIFGGLRGFQQLSGTTAIAFYTHEIFETAGDDISAHHAVMVYYLVQLILTTLSSSIVDKAGRRPLLIISMAGSALALFIEGTYFYIQTQTSIETGSFSMISVIGLTGFRYGDCSFEIFTNYESMDCMSHFTVLRKPYCGDRWYRWSFSRISQLKKNETCTLCIDESENSQLPSLIFSATNVKLLPLLFLSFPLCQKCVFFTLRELLMELL
ncbi:Sugar tr domain containing protein, partial [Asbolus verrucosus]